MLDVAGGTLPAGAWVCGAALTSIPHSQERSVSTHTDSSNLAIRLTCLMKINIWQIESAEMAGIALWHRSQGKMPFWGWPDVGELAVDQSPASPSGFLLEPAPACPPDTGCTPR